jgi:hypothetical protein
MMRAYQLVLLWLMVMLGGCQPKNEILLHCPDMVAGCGVDGVAISSNQPPQIMKPFQLTLEIENRALSEVYASFGMEGMEMGLNRYRMQQIEGGLWQAEITLPVCVRGRADWLMQIDTQASLTEQRYLITFETH